MKTKIYLSPPHMSGLELQYIQQAFDQNWIAPIGPNIDAFEEELAAELGVEHVAALASGTAAIHLALVTLGIGKGDEVIASSFTFAATINPIIYSGATPILVDSESLTWNMDPELLKVTIEDRIGKTGKKPKAILLVHIYGMPAQIDEIMKIAEYYEISVVEDAAESLGSLYKNKPTGTFGKCGVFSFNGNKIITTSGGGCLVAESEELINKVKFLSTQARDEAPWYQHSQIGYNYRMSNIVAGIGRGQLKVLKQRVDVRRDNYQWYLNMFKEVDGVKMLPEPENYFSNRWLSSIVIDYEKTRLTPADVLQALTENNIEARPIWKPMHLQPIFKAYPAYVNGTSEKIFNSGLCLPSGTNMSENDYDRIEKVLIRVFDL